MSERKKMILSYSKLLEMLHMDLMGPMQGRKYRDMSAIYHVLEGIDTIFHGEVLIWQNFERNPHKSTISRDISLQCLKKTPLFAVEGIQTPNQKV